MAKTISKSNQKS